MHARPPFLAVLLGALAAVSAPHAARSDVRPPETPRRPVQDVYHGVVVRDDYRWLEDWSAQPVRKWSDEENATARDYFDNLPDRPAILKRVTELSQSLGPSYFALTWRRGALFALKDRPPREQPLLVRLGTPDDTTSETVVVDPNTLDPSGSTSIDFYVPTLDGSKVAVSLSKNGSEDGTVSVFDGKTGARLGDEIPRVNGGTAGGSVAWTADGAGFWHTRYPAPGERPDADLSFYQQVYFHALGTPAGADRYAIGREFPKIAEIQMETSEDGRWLLVEVLNGDGGEHAFYVRTPQGRFQRVTQFADQAVEAHFGGDALFLLSRRHAPNGKILRVPLARPTLAAARVVVPAGGTAIEGFLPGQRVLYLRDVVGGPSRVRMVTFDGRAVGMMPLPPVSAVNGLVHTRGDEVLVRRASFVEPAAWFRYDPAHRGLRPTALVDRSPARFEDVEVLRVFATSRDGTRVPMTILMREGTRLDGTAPALRTGYGGYGIVMRPSFRSQLRLWLEQGGIWAQANIRGGGEYGEAWHRAGNLTHKQNVFDDFLAAGRYLISHKYTSEKRLAIEGGSNGGLLMGAALTQRPDLFRAVVSHVGIYDMLRVELSPNGLFNTTEFGTVKDPAQFRALYAYSPYHHVRKGAKYPAVLFTSGANDPRVDPMNSRKMTALLQASTGSGRPILLRTNAKTGHGIGTPLSERNEESADVFAFLFNELGIEYRPPAMPVP